MENTITEENLTEQKDLLTKPEVVEIKIYKRRWVMLIIFALYMASNSFQWIEYSIITNIIMKYYNVSSVKVDMTSLVFMITYIPLVFPATFVIEKAGLKNSLLIGTIGTTIGSWIKVFSVAPDRFYVTIFGQIIVALSQLFMLSLPASVASVWFGDDQVSTACSIGIFGNQLGVAAGFLIPPTIVKNHEDIHDIGENMKVLVYSVAVFSSVITGSILFFFESEPPVPPSYAQVKLRNNKEKITKLEFFKCLKRLVMNHAFMFLVLAYGISLGVLNAISTLLNQLILVHFSNGEEDAGRIGLLMVFSGMIGSVVFGVILDKTRKFKATTLVVYLMSAVEMAMVTLTLKLEYKFGVYLSSILLGLFMCGYMAVGFELSAELTFPEPESITTGILSSMNNLFGVIFVLLFGHMISTLGDVWCNVGLTLSLVIGTVLTAVTPNWLRRQQAQNERVVDN